MATGPRPPIPPGLAKVVFHGTIYGHSFRNVMYLQLTGGSVTVNDLTTLAGAIATAWNTDVAPAVSVSCILTQVQVVYIPSVGTELSGIWSGSYAGGLNVGAVEDAGCSFVVSWKTGAYYRGGHPRTYQPGVTPAMVTSGSDIGGTYASNVATGWNALKNAVNALTYASITAVTIGECSFQTAKNWRSPPIFRAYTSCSVRSKLGSQRRRILA